MHIAKEHITDYKWFVIVHEDTYLIMENLAYYVCVFNHSTPFYFGHVLTSWGQEYNAAGPGVVLSQAALRKLSQRLAKGHCALSQTAGDFVLAQCLTGSGITPVDTRDFLTRARFLMYQPEMHLVPGILRHFTLWSKNKYRLHEVSSETMLDK